MFKNITDILKSFDNKQRFTVLIVLLITIVASIFIKSYFSTADLAPMQKQLNECVVSQGVLVNQNASLVSKTKDLTDGYLKIDSTLRHLKPDTVYVIKYEQPTLLHRESVPNVATSTMAPEEEIMVAAVVRPAPDVKKDIKTIKKGNSNEIMSNLHDLIKEKTKK